MAMGLYQLRTNRWHKTFAFINADGDYLWNYFFNHILNYGFETVFLPNRQISFWDKWQSGEKALDSLDRLFLAAGFN
jgi:hypothetical protein